MAEGIKCKSCGGRIMANKCVNCGTVYTNKQVEEMANSSSKQIVHKKIDLKMSRVKSTDEKKAVKSSAKQTKQCNNIQAEPEIIKKIETQKSTVKNTDTQKANKQKESGNRLAQQTKSLKKAGGTTKTTINTKVPDTEISDTEMPDMEIPDMEMSDTEMSDMEIPDMEIPDMEIPDMEMSDTEMSDMEIPDMEMSDTEMPDMEISNEDMLDDSEKEIENTIDKINNDDLADDDGFEDVGKNMYYENDPELTANNDNSLSHSVEFDGNSKDDFQNENKEILSPSLKKNKDDAPKSKKKATLKKEKTEEKTSLSGVSVIDMIKKKRILSKAKKIEQIECDLDYDFNNDGFYDDVELTDKSLPSYFSKRDFTNALGFIVFMIGVTILLIYNI